jgi:hypothetical protein
MFQETILGFHAYHETDSRIFDASGAANGSAQFTLSHVLSLGTLDTDDGPPLPDANRPSRLRSRPTRFGEYVAHLPAYPPVFVTACCDLEQGKRKISLSNRSWRHPFLALRIFMLAPPILLWPSYRLEIAWSQSVIEMLSEVRSRLTGRWPCIKSMTPSCRTGRESSSTYRRVVRLLTACGHTKSSLTLTGMFQLTKLIFPPKGAVRGPTSTTKRRHPVIRMTIKRRCPSSEWPACGYF